MSTAFHLTDRLLRLGSTDDFFRVREFLRQSSFDDSSLCRLLRMDEMSDLGAVRWNEVNLADHAASLDWCARVFLRGMRSSREESVSTCGEDVINAFQSLGLIRSAKNDPSELVCPVWLYPVDGFVVASDRRDDPDGGPFVPAADVVFPAIYGGTLRFLGLLPAADGGDALDLCGGSGIGALRLSRQARRAVSADLTARSAFFAEFNARLNNMSMESLCGDLYDPVQGRQFDLITAHPPFVPAVGDNMIYRDGGASGEEIVRRIVQGLPDHLRPGGTCVIMCVARDTGNLGFEQRAAEWLGSAKGEFDIIYGLEKVLSVEEVVDGMRKRGENISSEQARALIDRLQSMDTKQFVHGALFLRRGHALVARPPVRIRLAWNGGAANFERLFAWRQFTRQPDFQKRLADSSPRLAPGLELNVRHLVNEGSLVPEEFVFSVKDGFEAAMRPDAWVVPLIARLEGNQSVREVFQAAFEKDELPEGFALQDFSELVEVLISRGFLEVDAAQ